MNKEFGSPLVFPQSHPKEQTQFSLFPQKTTQKKYSRKNLKGS